MKISEINLEPLAPHVVALAEQAGALICRAYQEVPEVIEKTDGSPVTQADYQSHIFLSENLKKLTPRIPIISEEDEKSWPLESPLYWLIDPLDGTRGFIEKNGEFCVNIALMEEGHPIMGIIHIPLTQETFYGYGNRAFRHYRGKENPIHTRPFPAHGAVHVVKGHSERGLAQEDAFLKAYPIVSVEKIHSAIKFTRIASGKADLYIRSESCRTWDTAAGQALVEAAGGVMQHFDGTPFVHGKPSVLNKPFAVFGQRL